MVECVVVCIFSVTNHYFEMFESTVGDQLHFFEEILEEGIHNDEVFYKYAKNGCKDSSFNPLEDYILIRSHYRGYAADSIALELGRNLKCVNLRLRMFNFMGISALSEKEVKQKMMFRFHERAKRYVEFYNNRLWVWQLVDDVECGLEESFNLDIID